MKKIILITLLSVFSLLGVSQNVSFVILKAANANYSFAVHNGLKMDTVVKGNVSPMGMANFVVPEKYKAKSVMGVLNIAEQKPIELILNSESFSFEISSEGKLSFNGSLENDILYSHPSDAMKDEYKTSYVQSHIKTMGALGKMSKVLTQQGQASLFEASNARLSGLNDVDVDNLYYSRFWYFLIDGLMQLSIGQEGFANDMMRLLDKTKSDEVYIAFVEDLITITNQFALDDAFDIIIPHVETSGRIKYPQGNVYDAFAMSKMRKGAKAPQIDGLSTPISKVNHDFVLLMFHHPGCDNCQKQLDELEGKYDFMKERKVRVITLSGAMDKSEFEEESKSFVWSDKLCDYKGYAGANFKKFGIIGTPTMFLLDAETTVLGRFSSIMEIESFLRGRL